LYDPPQHSHLQKKEDIRMIIHVISAVTAPGQEKEAAAWVKQLAQYANEKHGHSVEIMRSMDGRNGRYHWVHRVDSLAAWEATSAAWNADPQVQALLDEGRHLFTNYETHRYEVVS
jgi:antibiotic biosynthesis monooxygenase (ABM) superfamily enzyme